jgi:hypothetical protein
MQNQRTSYLYVIWIPTLHMQTRMHGVNIRNVNFRITSKTSSNKEKQKQILAYRPKVVENWSGGIFYFLLLFTQWKVRFRPSLSPDFPHNHCPQALLMAPWGTTIA